MEFVSKYNLVAPPTLPNEPVELEQYVPPKSAEVSATFNFIPIQSDYIPVFNAVNTPVSIGEYTAPKVVDINPVINLNQDVPEIVEVEEYSVQQDPITSIQGLQPNITFAGQNPLFLLAGASGLGNDWSLFPAKQDVDFSSYGITGLGNVYMTGGITGVADISMNNANITGCQSLKIDNQVLTADPTDLLLNGIPIATISGLPEIEKWAEYDALANVVMNGAGVSGQPFSVLGAKTYTFNSGSTLSADTNTLYFNGSAVGGTGYTGVSLWSTYPMIHNIVGNNYNISGISGISGNSAIFNTITGNTGIFTNLSATNINGTGYTATSNWANFPAVSNVNLSGHSIQSGTSNSIAINTDVDLDITTGSGSVNVETGFSGLFKQNINTNSGQVNITADLESAIGFDSAINLTAQNGNRGNIALDSKKGNAGLGGVVSILAEGGSLDGYGYGGLVTIDATSESVLTGLTSAIKLSAGGINSYAGAKTSVGSVFGYNYVYGSLGVNIIASAILGPSVNIPLTVYISADNGVVIGTTMYVNDTITNYYNGASNPSPLNITGRTVAFVDYPVNLDKVGSITFTSQQSGQINGCKQFSGNNTAMTGINSIQVADVNITGSASINSITTNTIVAKTANSLTLSGVSAISGNAIVINSGSGTITIEGAETDITSTNTYITNASIETLTATTINGVSGTNVVAPCKFLTGTFGTVALTTAPIVVYQSPSLTWNWNGIAGLGTSTSITVGVDTVGSYAFAMQFLVGSTTYNLNTYTLSAPFVANSSAYNGVNVCSATLNDSFNNTIANGSSYKILVYMWNGNNSTANTTGAKLNFNFTSAQSL